MLSPGEAGGSGRSHSLSFDQRLRPDRKSFNQLNDAGFRFAKIGNDTLIDAVCIHDDLTLRPCRNTSVRRTTGIAPDEMTSASTWPGPTEGSWSMSPTIKTVVGYRLHERLHQEDIDHGGL